MIENRDIKELKSRGIIQQRDTAHFVLRIPLSAGCASAAQLRCLAEVAERFGHGYVGATMRMSVEIPWIKYEDIDPALCLLNSADLSPGGTGARIRPIAACKGTVCKWGMFDTQQLCRTLQADFVDRPMPAKTKIAITGCPNNCAKVQTNDIGIMGFGRGKVRFFLGGTFGKKPSIGEDIGLTAPVEDVPRILNAVLEIYQSNAKDGQRLGAVIHQMKESGTWQSALESIVYR